MMSKTTGVLVVCCAFAVALVACAMGGSSTHQGNADAPPAVQMDAPPGGQHDATSSPADAKVFMDAHQFLDAHVFNDAPQFGHEGDVCSDNTGCDANMGLCCFVIACVQGTGIGTDICFPDN